MALIDWDDNLSVNISLVDEQHKKLIGIMNELYDAMEQNKASDILDKIVISLIDYTDTHFGMEERYFDKLGYPGMATHKSQHAIFTKKITEFREKLKQGNPGLYIKVIGFLGDWFQNHIKGTDLLYVDFFKENGVE